MFKILIIVVVAAVIFGKVVVPIWMEVEDAQYERQRKKNRKASAVERAEQRNRKSGEDSADVRKGSQSDEETREARHHTLQERANMGHGPSKVALSKERAEQGDVDAQLYLAQVYEGGLDGQKKYPNLALSWYRKAADNGSGYACYRVYELTGEHNYLQRAEKLGASGGRVGTGSETGKISAEAARVLAETASETPTAFNYARIQHALALLIQSKLPNPLRTGLDDDNIPSITRYVNKYVKLDAEYRKVPEIKDWFERRESFRDGLANLKYIYNHYPTPEQDGPERTKDRITMVDAITLIEIRERMEDVYVNRDFSVIREIARLYLRYNKPEAKAWLDEGISRNDGACLLEAYDEYETYGYDFSDACDYLDRAISMGYKPAIQTQRAEALEWEREKAAMRRERYEDPAAKRKREEQERAERRKALDEKLDQAERFINSDLLTNEEQYQLGRRDVYDHVRDELFREALHDMFD